MTSPSFKNNANRKASLRASKGVSLIELPMMLGLLLVMLLMPMLGLATLTVKSSLLNAAVQDGVHLASKARTFQAGTADKPAAMQLADTTIKSSSLKWAGLTVSNVQTNIIITPVAGGASTRQSGKLATPADTSRFIYQIETVATGQIEPLFRLNPGVIGSIPGVSAPAQVSYSAREMAENPQGLNK